MAIFEKITQYADADLPMPQRATAGAAGYDFAVAEDTIIPPYNDLISKLALRSNLDNTEEFYYITLDEIATLTKETKCKPTLVPTGMKCKLDAGTYLELSVRSSCPLKHWLILANGVGIIDADYYNNEDNEGHIYFQIINLSPFHILLKKGNKIGQGIIKPYLITENDKSGGLRTGGFGSTTK